VARMRNEPRIMDCPHMSMTAEKSRNGHRASLLPRDADRDGAKAAQREPCIERRAGDARAVCPRRKLFGVVLSRRDDSAADHVGMAVQIFGGGVDDEVRAEQKRLLQDG